MTNLLDTDFVKWANEPKEKSDGIIISCRVRLARNIPDLPFPHRFDEKTGQDAAKRFDELFEHLNNSFVGFSYCNPATLTETQLQILTEKHLITPSFAEKAPKSYERLLLKDDGSIAILFNEEDHIRIQCLLPGLCLDTALKEAEQMDNLLESIQDFAFDDHLGYLTASPANVGTGLKASVLLHLPATRIAGQIDIIAKNISRLGFSLTGLYGDGNKATSNLFLLTSQVTIGQSEAEIITYLADAATKLAEEERKIRTELKNKNSYRLIDRIRRANGLLRNAYLLDKDEALQLISELRLGTDLEIVEKVPTSILNELLFAINPGHLSRTINPEKKTETLEWDALRAKTIQEKLKTF